LCTLQPSVGGSDQRRIVHIRNRNFDYIRDGEELVLGPYNRLIESDEFLACTRDSCWPALDTLRDKQVLEDMAEKGSMPWRFDRETGERDS
jgi:glucose-1-phosphate cytidylyltransferase